MGVAALLLGILALVLACIPVGLTQIVGVAVGLGALVLGVMARRSARAVGRKDRSATAGLVLGAVGLLASAAFYATCVVVMTNAGEELQGAGKEARFKLGAELRREFNRRHGSDQFREALGQAMEQGTRALKRASAAAEEGTEGAAKKENKPSISPTK